MAQKPRVAGKSKSKNVKQSSKNKFGGCPSSSNAKKVKTLDEIQEIVALDFSEDSQSSEDDEEEATVDRDLKPEALMSPISNISQWVSAIKTSGKTSMPDERWQEYLNYGIPLYKAALRGDWEAAKQIHSKHPECFTARITKQGDTALHIAAVARRSDFVLQLVTLMVNADAIENLLVLRNNIGNTALCLAAASGTVAIAKVMVHVHPELPMIRGNEDLTPLLMAALLGHREMVRYSP